MQVIKKLCLTKKLIKAQVTSELSSDMADSVIVVISDNFRIGTDLDLRSMKIDFKENSTKKSQ